MIQQGGWAMYPLGLCSLAMFFLIFHSWRETSRQKFIPQGGVDTGLQLLAEFRIDEASVFFKQHDTVLCRVVDKALRRIRPDVAEVNKPKAEATVVEHLEAEESAVAQWVNYLNVVGAVAPMIGLLGTVSGMISAFQTIGQGGMGRPELLASDIGEALITTATGLVIGIPAMVSYFILRNRLSAVVVETSQIASDLLDEIPVNVVFEEE
jgi:biopolymer transport protein ExbB